MSPQTSAPPWSVWRAMTVMTRTLVSGLESELQHGAGISVPDYEILDALSRNDGRQSRARDLALMLSWEKSRLSHHVRRMEQRGLVERMDCATDLRGTWVMLTTAGATALDRARDVVSAYLDQRLGHVLSPSERATLAGLALKVLEASDLGSCQIEVERISEDLAT